MTYNGQKNVDEYWSDLGRRETRPICEEFEEKYKIILIGYPCGMAAPSSASLEPDPPPEQSSMQAGNIEQQPACAVVPSREPATNSGSKKKTDSLIDKIMGGMNTGAINPTAHQHGILESVISTQDQNGTATTLVANLNALNSDAATLSAASNPNMAHSLKPLTALNPNPNGVESGGGATLVEQRDVHGPDPLQRFDGNSMICSFY